jgi:hypothetical protein
MSKKAVFAVLATAVIAALVPARNFTYVGANKCQICHRTEAQGRQFPIWEASKHPLSFKALTSPQAVDAAKAMGVENPAEDPSCLKCHAPLHGQEEEIKAEGVTCEACHGPGSEYKQLSVMQDRAEAVKSGLILRGTPEAIRASCLECHESAHGMAFDFPARWEKIRHPIPGR